MSTVLEAEERQWRAENRRAMEKEVEGKMTVRVGRDDVVSLTKGLWACTLCLCVCEGLLCQQTYLLGSKIEAGLCQSVVCHVLQVP